MPPKQKEKRQPTTHASKTNINDVFIKALDVFYDLSNGGQIVALIILIVAMVMIILAFRMPTENIDSYIKEIFVFLRSPQYPLAIVSVALTFSVTVNIIQKKVYCKEIERHVELRSELMHGLSGGTLQALPEHKTSEFKLSSEL